MSSRKPFLDLVVTDVSDRAIHLGATFAAKAAEDFFCNAVKVNHLNWLIDEIERLPEEFDHTLDVRRAVREGLQICWNNLPPEKAVANAIKPRIIHTAVVMGVPLTKDLEG